MRAAIDAQRGLFARTAQRRIYPSPSSGVAESAHEPRRGRRSQKTGSCVPTRAREGTYSTVFGCMWLYSLYLCRSCSRGALKTRHTPVFPP